MLFNVSIDKFNAVIYQMMAGQEGLEPPTFGFGDRRSTN
jgi:hypothetical protein